MTTSGPEVKGSAQDGTSLYGLVMAEQWPLRASDSIVKIVWRMTGSGDLTVVVDSPSGVDEQLAWGPEPHGSSSYNRPGDEWRTGLVLNVPGCWHLAFTRSERGSADAWLSVAP